MVIIIDIVEVELHAGLMKLEIIFCIQNPTSWAKVVGQPIFTKKP